MWNGFVRPEKETAEDLVVSPIRVAAVVLQGVCPVRSAVARQEVPGERGALVMRRMKIVVQ